MLEIQSISPGGGLIGDIEKTVWASREVAKSAKAKNLFPLADFAQAFLSVRPAGKFLRA